MQEYGESGRHRREYIVAWNDRLSLVDGLRDWKPTPDSIAVSCRVTPVDLDDPYRPDWRAFWRTGLNGDEGSAFAKVVVEYETREPVEEE